VAKILLEMNPPRFLKSLLRQAALAALALVFVLPLAWMVAASLRTPGLPPPRTIEWFPNPAAWDNYLRIFELAPLTRYTLNSLLVVGLAVPLTLLTASWAGLALAQLPADERGPLIRLSIILLMVPATAVWLGRFFLYKQLGLVNSVLALVAPAFMGTTPFFVLLFYWTFRRFPTELYDSARLDGANALVVWRYIAFPLARPTAVGVAVLAFVFYWGDFFSPLLYLKSPGLYTLPVGLQLLQQMDRTNYPLLMAASVVMVVPVLVMFLILHYALLREVRLHEIAGHE
jgi:multiple sugar transport system permease protein